ncbi:MAG: PAS domain S-box protein [Deltaproteobacteria bacterium]|nr:PAS domain S-box protein [Deltaproteobacteria bacterium]
MTEELEKRQLINELNTLRKRLEETKAELSRLKQGAGNVLLESEKRYRRMIEATTDYIYTVTVKEGHAVETRHGPGCLAVTGYATEEFAADPYLWINMVIEEEREKIKDHARRILTGKIESAIEHRIIRKDGTMRWVRNTPVLHVNEQGCMEAYEGLVQDITERKQAEENLKRSEEKHRNIIDNLPNGYYEVDLAGNITFLNKALCATFGGTRDEIMGLNYRAYATPESAREAFRVFNQLYKTGDNHAKIMHYEIVRADGTICPIELDVDVVRDEDGKPIGFRGIGRDITDRIKLEEERIKLKEQLNQSQKMEAIGTLAGGIAHDFNNLLMGIQGYASLMLLKTSPTHPHYEKLKSIEKQVRTGAELTKQLLGFARGGRYEVKSLNINEIVSKTSQLFGRTKKEIIIHDKLANDLWCSEVDQGQIEQLLLNLYVNAWQAMPSGGHLYLETRNCELDEGYSKFHAAPPGKYVKVSVTDTGLGMDDKTKERIFEPFFTTRDMGRGTGLGLAAVYGIVKGHKGIINVYSERGKGTTFNIYLPASEKQIQQKPKINPVPTRGRETIFIVDDEDFILDVTREMLENMGYNVFTAKSGEEAIEVFKTKKEKIDLIIVDMIMPGMSGEETFDRIKEIKPEVRAILASGYSLNGQAIRILDKGCRTFIQKPFALADLCDKIRETLS